MVEEKEFLYKMENLLKRVLYVEDLGFEVSLDTRIINGTEENGLDISSIDYIFLMSLVEEEFGFIYDFDMLIYTIGDIYSYLKDTKER